MNVNVRTAEKDKGGGMMSIDEAIQEFRQLEYEFEHYMCDTEDVRENLVKYQHEYEYYKQLADWLEELKQNRIALEKANGYLEANYRLGYNKAIDDLLGGMNQITYNCQDADELFGKICDLAEQLKAGNSNERN